MVQKELLGTIYKLFLIILLRYVDEALSASNREDG